MARLRDFLPAVRASGAFSLLRAVWRRSNEDDLFTLAAALAYSWLFAIFPFLLFLLTLAPYLPRQQKDYARMEIATAIRHTLPKDAATAMLSGLDGVLDQPRAGLLSVGLVVTLWVASGGVSMTMSALDKAFAVPQVRPFYIQRPLAVLLTIVLTVLVLLVLLLMPIGTALLHWLTSFEHLPRPLLLTLNFARQGLAIALMFCVLALLYRYGTAAPRRLTFLSPGSVFTVAVWVLLASAFGFYVNRFGSYQKTYGTLGGVAIILFFFYIDALVLMLGAEINAAVEKVVAPPAADPRAAPRGQVAGPAEGNVHASSAAAPSTSSSTGLIES